MLASSGPTVPMFTIELLIVSDRKSLVIVDRITSVAAELVDADRGAQSLLERAQRMRPQGAPDGYRILADDGQVVLRSWERDL
jgi:hypothetical protein